MNRTGYGMMAAAACAVCAAMANARTRESFNGGWEFSRDGEAFESVGVPHDWAIEGPFDPKADGDTGKLPWKGKGVYRKSVVLAEKPKGRVFLDFDGVMARSAVFVNGEPVGGGRYGYLGFRVDATPYLLAGTNQVEVRCDTLAHKSRWYPGGGLYRNTWIVRTDDVYVQDDSLRIETRNVLTKEAEVALAGRIVSRRLADEEIAVSVTLRDPSGKTVASAAVRTTVVGYGEGDFAVKLAVPEPKLWEMADGAALYALEVRAEGRSCADALVRRIGLREFRFDPQEGFFLNGRRVQIKGVNLHSDLGPLGMAFDKGAMRRQLAVMRDMGANALRTSHNCPAPEVLDLCDEMGFFVWDECFDKWNGTCGRGEAPLEEFVSRTLAEWVRRDRLHPCVFVWSIGNEISPGKASPPGQTTVFGQVSLGTTEERCATFRRAVLAEDAERPVGIGSCFGKRVVDRGDYAMLDATGWNYGGQYKFMKKRHPEKPVFYTESASAYSEFGYYAPTLPTNMVDYAAGFHVDSYDLNASDWSEIADVDLYFMERDRYCCGEFVWTGIDYLGEPCPYHPEKGKDPRLASRSSYFGICDLCVLPKDRFYLYRSHWNETSPTLHLVPGHWNFPEKAGKTMPVFVYTSFDEAELFVNGRSQGRRKKDKSAAFKSTWYLDRNYYAGLPRYRLMWMDVPYEAGEVKAVAYGRDGKPAMTEVLRTAGAPTRVVLTPERTYDGLQVVVVTLADRDGNFVPGDNRRISFEAKGCEILAVGNSDPRGYESFKATESHPLCFGRAAVYVRLGGGQGSLKAFANGLEAASVELGGK